MIYTFSPLIAAICHVIKNQDKPEIYDFAVIDYGSLGFQLSIFRYEPGTLTVLSHKSDMSFSSIEIEKHIKDSLLNSQKQKLSTYLTKDGWVSVSPNQTLPPKENRILMSQEQQGLMNLRLSSCLKLIKEGAVSGVGKAALLIDEPTPSHLLNLSYKKSQLKQLLTETLKVEQHIQSCFQDAVKDAEDACSLLQSNPLSVSTIQYTGSSMPILLSDKLVNMPSLFTHHTLQKLPNDSVAYGCAAYAANALKFKIVDLTTRDNSEKSHSKGFLRLLLVLILALLFLYHRLIKTL